ncbi:hypothetical protein [Glutamicibacter soli]|uniref:hypothetical protein n=1 Tax=Glutamicibacter soli TaxID=453836 RepID=UPI0011BF9A25|nr:hypothetical protein [Glutamicibacter soli]
MTSISVPAKGALIALATISVGLIIAALIVVSLRPAPPLRDADTPAGVVQRYVLAFQSSDLSAAQKLVEDGGDKQVCDPYSSGGETAQVSLVREATTEQTSTITVSMAYGSEGGLFFESYESQDVFELKKVNGTWLITATPWQMGLCTAEEMGL